MKIKLDMGEFDIVRELLRHMTLLKTGGIDKIVLTKENGVLAIETLKNY